MEIMLAGICPCKARGKQLGFNAAEMGMIFSAFFIGYALFNLQLYSFFLPDLVPKLPEPFVTSRY